MSENTPEYQVPETTETPVEATTEVQTNPPVDVVGEQSTEAVDKPQPEPEVKSPAKSPEQPKSAGKVNHTKVDTPSRIVEVADGMTQPGTLLLTNHTRKELATWYTKLVEQLAELQEERSKLSNKELKDGEWMRWTVAEDMSFIVTQDEVKLLEALMSANWTTHPGLEDKFLLTDSVPATNMPGYTPDNPRVQGMMYSPKAEDIRDPVTRIRRKLGLAVSRWVPLMTSGFRMELSAPSNMELLNLETKLLMEKINTSAETYGYALSSSNAYLDRALIDFILDHVENNTAWKMTKSEMLRHISLADYDTLVTAMASTIFPDGYPMERTMFREKHPEGVTGTPVRKKLNIQRMMVTRWNYLSESQRNNIYSNRHAGTTAEISERLVNHRQSIREDIPQFVELSNGITVKLHIPTLEEYLRIGLRFQTGLEDHVRNTLSMEATEDERESYLARASEVSRVMFMAHWVEGIYTKDNGSGEMIPDVVRVKDPSESAEKIAEADDGIRLILEDIAVFPAIADKLMKEIETYVNKVKLSFAVVTREPNTIIEPGEHPSVVPINPVEVFFTLLRHKILMAGG